MHTFSLFKAFILPLSVLQCFLEDLKPDLYMAQLNKSNQGGDLLLKKTLAVLSLCFSA